MHCVKKPSVKKLPLAGGPEEKNTLCINSVYNPHVREGERKELYCVKNPGVKVFIWRGGVEIDHHFVHFG
jgi:hypothetical protein